MGLTKKEKAIDSFRSGLNCAQAVLTVYTNDLNFDESLALRISCGFGGGMGRLQETCGAVTGSYMVFGMHICGKYADNKERKEETYALVQKFSDKFTALHGTMNCKQLINCDLGTEEGQRYAKKNDVHGTICEKCIADSIEIIEELTTDHL